MDSVSISASGSANTGFRGSTTNTNAATSPNIATNTSPNANANTNGYAGGRAPAFAPGALAWVGAKITGPIVGANKVRAALSIRVVD